MQLDYITKFSLRQEIHKEAQKTARLLGESTEIGIFMFSVPNNVIQLDNVNQQNEHFSN